MSLRARLGGAACSISILHIVECSGGSAAELLDMRWTVSRRISSDLDIRGPLPSFILVASLGSASSRPASQQPGRSHKKSSISFFTAFQPHLPALLPQLR